MTERTAATIEWNEGQKQVIADLQSFFESDEQHFMLLGGGGVGKSTVIAYTLSKGLKPQPSAIFASFTNKAARNLSNMLIKNGVTATCNTIHKMLGLMPDDSNDVLEFGFDLENITYLKDYDVIVLEECSTISKDLFKFILASVEHINKLGKKLKIIYLGDYYQLPPVGEDYSVVFKFAKTNEICVSRLTQQMRSRTQTMSYLSERLSLWCTRINKCCGDDFIKNYPNNILKTTFMQTITTPTLQDLAKYYIECVAKHHDTIVLTYSKKSVDEINNMIQDMKDNEAGREITSFTRSKALTFYVGDIICFDKPCEVCVVYKQRASKKASATAENDATPIQKTDEDSENEENEDEDTTSNEEPIYKFGKKLTTLYNADTFLVTATKNIKIFTSLNVMKYSPKYFDAQLLTIKCLDGKIFDVVHIDSTTKNRMYMRVKRAERKMRYKNIIKDFTTVVPNIAYGYALTVYKAQGSEWDNVMVNLKNIYWSLKNTSDAHKKIFSATYTALSRAKNQIKIHF